MTTDATPGGATKNVLASICQSLTNATVEATTARVEFSNIQSRFDPEMTAANIPATEIAFARKAEDKLLAKMDAAAGVVQVTAATVVGGSRDILVMLDRATAYFRNRRRLDDTVRMRVILPLWARNLIRADLTRAMHTAAFVESLAVADEQINGWFNRRGINVTWYLDGQPEAAVTGPPAVAAQL